MPMFKHNTDWVLLLVIIFSKHSELWMEHSEKNIVLSVFLFFIYIKWILWLNWIRKIYSDGNIKYLLKIKYLSLRTCKGEGIYTPNWLRAWCLHQEFAGFSKKKKKKRLCISTKPKHESKQTRVRIFIIPWLPQLKF